MVLYDIFAIHLKIVRQALLYSIVNRNPITKQRSCSFPITNTAARDYTEYLIFTERINFFGYFYPK